MKKYLIQNCKCLAISGLLIFTICPARGQIVNFVRDPSFEDTLSSIGYATSMALLHWQNLDSANLFAASSAYFSVTQPFVSLRLPKTLWYDIYPRSGLGTVGFENFYSTSKSEFKRSLVKCKLTGNLVLSQKYYAKLHLVPGARLYNRFSDGISMYFDNGQLDTMVSIKTDSTGIYPLVVPQVINPYGNVITDTVNWSVLEGCFMANGTETYLTIGNFKPDSLTATAINFAGDFTPGGDTASGMLIDDVCVYAVDMQNWVPDATGILNDSITIGLPNYQIPDAKWYSITGQYLGAGSQIKVYASQPQQQYVCAIEMCNTTVYDTFWVTAWPLGMQVLQSASFSVYPNPTSGVLHVNAHAKELISLSNVNGQVLSIFVAASGTEVLDISGFASGVYFVQVGAKRFRVIRE
jgi:hypothetical protein